MCSPRTLPTPLLRHRLDDVETTCPGSAGSPTSGKVPAGGSALCRPARIDSVPARRVAARLARLQRVRDADVVTPAAA